MQFLASADGAVGGSESDLRRGARNRFWSMIGSGAGDALPQVQGWTAFRCRWLGRLRRRIRLTLRRLLTDLFRNCLLGAVVHVWLCVIVGHRSSLIRSPHPHVNGRRSVVASAGKLLGCSMRDARGYAGV